jgi:hypothetical protein
MSAKTSMIEKLNITVYTGLTDGRRRTTVSPYIVTCSMWTITHVPRNPLGALLNPLPPILALTAAFGSTINHCKRNKKTTSFH